MSSTQFYVRIANLCLIYEQNNGAHWLGVFGAVAANILKTGPAGP